LREKGRREDEKGGGEANKKEPNLSFIRNLLL
jgi:hypothetical protein